MKLIQAMIMLSIMLLMGLTFAIVGEGLTSIEHKTNTVEALSVLGTLK